MFAKDAGIVPGDSSDDSVFDVNDGCEVRIDLLGGSVIVTAEEGDSVGERGCKAREQKRI